MDGERERGERRRSERRGRREESESSRAALAGTGAAFSELSTFFNARRQLSRPSLSLPLALSFSLARLLPLPTSIRFFGSSTFVSTTTRVRHLLPPRADDRQFLPPRTTSPTGYREGRRHRRVFALVGASENRETGREFVWPQRRVGEFTKQNGRLLCRGIVRWHDRAGCLRNSGILRNHVRLLIGASIACYSGIMMFRVFYDRFVRCIHSHEAVRMYVREYEVDAVVMSDNNEFARDECYRCLSDITLGAAEERRSGVTKSRVLSSRRVLSGSLGKYLPHSQAARSIRMQ